LNAVSTSAKQAVIFQIQSCTKGDATHWVGKGQWQRHQSTSAVGGSACQKSSHETEPTLIKGGLCSLGAWVCDQRKKHKQAHEDWSS
jgi:hypothetical protein